MKSLLEEKIQNGPLLSVFLVAKTQTHTTHTLSTPAVAEYLPASQPWHVAAPAVLESLPASQLEQVATEVAPTAVENLPAVQLVQTVEPAIYVHTLSHTTKGGAR